MGPAKAAEVLVGYRYCSCMGHEAICKPLERSASCEWWKTAIPTFTVKTSSTLGETGFGPEIDDQLRQRKPLEQQSCTDLATCGACEDN